MGLSQSFDTTISTTTSGPSRPLKGRRKFNADLSDLQARTEFSVLTGRWSVKNVRPGDDEGTFMFDLVECETETKDIINILVSDTSEYPSDHTFFGYSYNGESTPQIAEIIERLPGRRACSLRDVVDFFLIELSHGDHEDEDCEVSSDLGDQQLDDEQTTQDFSTFMEPGPSSQAQLCLNYLKRDFMETSDAGYNPGIVWAASNDFLLTVSLPVVSLVEEIPPHALLAWDRHFLELGQNLVLLISGFRGFYPILQEDGTLLPGATCAGGSLSSSLPSADEAKAAFRHFDFNHPVEANSTLADYEPQTSVMSRGVFKRISLSNSLESLLDKYLLRLIQLRRTFNLAAQDDPANIFSANKEMLSNAEKGEERLSASYHLPNDPFVSGSPHINVMKAAFAFVLRRLALYTRHCAVCHKKLHDEYEALKPYVCGSRLCIFQYYSLNFGSSLRYYEICTNSETIYLLVSLAYTAAAEGALGEPFPRGMGLRVPRAPWSNVEVDDDGLCDFDALTVDEMQIWIITLLDTLPPVRGHPKARIQDMNSTVPPAAWSLMKWCIASCTAHIQELKNREDFLGNIGDEFRQFRFMTGAPDKEAKFKRALAAQLPHNSKAKKYPTIFGFHGSPVKNWHSIIRHGLWYKHIANGRSHGNGVYCARDGTISVSGFASRSTAKWRSSSLMPSRCFVLAEIINIPSQFACMDPYVVDKTDWIMCRYLLVEPGNHEESRRDSRSPELVSGNFLKQDPRWMALLGSVPVKIPKPSHHLDKLLEACRKAWSPAQYDEEDMAIFNVPNELQDIDIPASAVTPRNPPREKWASDHDWVENNVQNLLPPPTESSTIATIALQRELKGIYKEQQRVRKRDEMELLGWYIPPEFNEDNLYQWIVEMHSFYPELPAAKDMKEKGVNSLMFEIRFPPSFPHSPPFFRMICPHFLTYMEGGGGHVTVGGSICMDLLMSEDMCWGWLPSYSIPAILLQIKLTILNTDPWPVRLHLVNWNRPYTPREALNGYTWAAALHNWKAPLELVWKPNVHELFIFVYLSGSFESLA
ncbi:hypothetical protein V8B97DRAFT_2025481 [Scleroderma yunnanense]